MSANTQTLIKPAVMDGWLRLLEPVRRYHRHAVEGMEHIPAEGPALLVIHHSLATYDGFLFALKVFHQQLQLDEKQLLILKSILRGSEYILILRKMYVFKGCIFIDKSIFGS